ncbi:AB hydrolase-1 domain-containing protein [Citrus sinensis]|uniref:AB hydrolase-1 domain-containing protein n=1 Tax=Citrus sinensis TaxID=2711 RepID=A0ACB8M859_CITSI|nr:AB hydrolase-1 domain-containing protein [Citrus sinensis]
MPTPTLALTETEVTPEPGYRVHHFENVTVGFQDPLEPVWLFTKPLVPEKLDAAGIVPPSDSSTRNGTTAQWRRLCIDSIQTNCTTSFLKESPFFFPINPIWRMCTSELDYKNRNRENDIKLRIGNGNGDVKGLRLPLLSNKSWQFQLQLELQQRNKEKKKRQNVTFSYTNSSSGGDSASAALELEVNEIRESCKMWKWKGQYSINYLVSSTPNSHPDSPPLLLVHGFGASIPHWRRNIGTLAKSYTVYAIHLLGFGASDKPAGYSYTMEAWAQLILDFLDEVVQKPTVLIGNSVGSLACVIAASESSQTLVRGLVLLNCAGGMNNKAIVDDWRIKLLLQLLWFIDFLLKQRPIASAIFERVKQRETLRNILLSIYGNKESVDETLVEIIREPANEEGALYAFVSIVTGPPGPNPVQLMPSISIPVLVLWGYKDPFTPLDGPVGKYFSSLPSKLSNVKLIVLEGVGHCPHDDRPELVHEKMLPWLAEIFNF